ncbi:unnamed protein product [Lymnaea stagnalis]|uniref:Suppressor of anucleate metulae protein B n=1 Tax=Lymnaea stagnalis TaxID=6523 RepID=A0AAV2HQ91_LYMST
MTSLSTLVCGLRDDDVELSLENEVLKKWGLYNALRSFSDRARISGAGSHNIAIDPKADTELLSWYESGSGNDLYSFSGTNIISVSLKDTNYNNAHDCYLKGQFCDALIYLDYAFESRDQSVDARLWTLRAKVMNAVEDHLETLKSIVHVQEAERSFELYIEGAKALEKLGLVITSEEWLKTIVLSASGDISRDKWVQTAYKLLQEIHTQRVYLPYVKEAPVRVFITGSGRGLAPTKTVLKGQLLFAELPELIEQNMASDSITACAHCGLSLVKPEDVFSKGHLAIADLQRAFKKFWPKRKSTPCKTCDRVVYCNDTCRDAAWQRYHKVICPTVPNSTVAMLYDVRKSFRDVMPTDGSSWQGWWNAEFSPTLLSKLWATIISTAKLAATGTGQPSKTDWVKAASQFEKYSSAGGSVSAQETIPKMFELMVNIFKRSKVLRYDVTAEDFNKRHQQVQTNFIEFHDVTDALHGFVDKMRQDPKRNKKIGQFFQEPLPRAEFHGLFPLASTINHSCFPNAKILSGVLDGKPGIRVMATKEIEAGEEITVAYVDTGLKKAERRKKLWSRYAFLCQCPRCLYEGDGPEVCTHCGKKADDGPNISSTLVLNKDAPVYESSCLSRSNKPQLIPFSTKGTPVAIVPAAGNVTPTSTGTSSTTVKQSTTSTPSTIANPTTTATANMTPTTTMISSASETDSTTSTLSSTAAPLATATTFNNSTLSTTDTPKIPDRHSTIATPSATALITNRVKDSPKMTAVVASSLLTSEDPQEMNLSANSEVIKTQMTRLAFGDSMFSACTAEIPEQGDHRSEQVCTYSTLRNANNDSFVIKQSRDESRVTHPGPSVESTSHNQGMSPNALRINQDTDCGSCCHDDRDGNIKTSHNINESLTGEMMAGNRAGLRAPTSFPHCGRCGRAWYCSQACQKEAWKKGHKKVCAKKL